MADERQPVKDGTFGLFVTFPDGTKEIWEDVGRKVEIVGNHIVVTRKGSGKVTILPPGSRVQTCKEGLLKGDWE